MNIRAVEVLTLSYTTIGHMRTAWPWLIRIETVKELSLSLWEYLFTKMELRKSKNKLNFLPQC